MSLSTASPYVIGLHGSQFSSSSNGLLLSAQQLCSFLIFILLFLHFLLLSLCSLPMMGRLYTIYFIHKSCHTHTQYKKKEGNLTLT